MRVQGQYHFLPQRSNGLCIRVKRLLGHADLQMATRYVQDVSAHTDRVIENSRIYVCQISK
jgi:hypothetical protein